MDIAKKLSLLADAAKYDASCSSSGSKTKREGKGIGSTEGMGICHSYTPDGRCVSLLKILLTNYCIYDCGRVGTHLFTVPASFLSFAETIACYRSEERWDLLYQLLFRLTHGEKHLLAITTDPLIHKLHLMEKAVRRDAHKMKAFVRFRKVEEEGEEHYIAWHEPDHYVVHRTAPFSHAGLLLCDGPFLRLTTPPIGTGRSCILPRCEARRCAG